MVRGDVIKALYHAGVAARDCNLGAILLANRLGPRLHPAQRVARTMTAGRRSDPQNLLGHALTLHKQGRLAEAEAVYEQMLRRHPESFDALHMLGVLATQARRPDRAVEYLQKALREKSSVAAAHMHLGKALMDLGRLEDAISSYDNALALKPDLAEGWINRGAALFQLGRLPEALRSADEALSLKPDSVNAHVNRGAVLSAMTRHEQALQSLDNALSLSPDCADAHANRAAVLKDLGRPAEALASADRAVMLAPGSALAHYNRGDVLCLLRRSEEALTEFERSIALQADNARAHSGCAAALLDLHRPSDALLSCDRAIALEPGFAPAYSNRGAALRELQRPLEAVESCRRALELRPELAAAYMNLGAALADLQQPKAAVEAYDMAISLKVDSARAHTYRGTALQQVGPMQALESYSRALQIEAGCAEALWSAGLCHLQMGQFEQGWRLYESRKQLPIPIAARVLPQPLWDGEACLKDKTLLIHAEQGLGDTIQFCRYARLAQARGARVTLAVQRPLHALLLSLDPEIRIISDDEALPATDLHCPLLSLPKAFRTNEFSIPASVPYLSVDAGRVQRWREKLRTPGFKIGICWQGSAARVDVGRSFPLRMLHPLCSAPGVRLISLQKNHGVEQLRELPAGMEVDVLGDDFDAGPDAFLDSAAVMQSLDLIVTSDTAIAHLAGALAVPTWLALRRVPDWRWLLEREDSPWYPTLRLFRQSRSGAWEDVFSRMHEELLRRLTRQSAAGSTL
jgi:tetratricopeptide (TPR) repeat protein